MQGDDVLSEGDRWRLAVTKKAMLREPTSARFTDLH